MLSRKPGCAVYTKCLDTHPKRVRLGSSSSPAQCTRERALRRREQVDNSVGRLSPLQTMYPRPSRQQRRRLPHHCLRPHLGCNRQTKAARDEQTDEKLSHFGPPSNGASLFTPN